MKYRVSVLRKFSKLVQYELEADSLPELEERIFSDEFEMQIDVSMKNVDLEEDDGPDIITIGLTRSAQGKLSYALLTVLYGGQIEDNGTTDGEPTRYDSYAEALAERDELIAFSAALDEAMTEDDYVIVQVLADGTFSEPITEEQA